MPIIFRYFFRALILLFVVNHLLLVAQAESELTSSPVNVELVTPSEQVVESFERNDCPSILRISKAYKQTEFSPLVLAVIATCVSDTNAAIKIFEEANALRPNNQVILILYAQSLFNSDRAASMDVWRKVALVTRDQSVKRLAEDYLSGDVQEGDQEALSIGKITTGFLAAQLGQNYTSNPGLASMSTIPADSNSWGSAFDVGASLQKNTNWGDWGGLLSMNALSYYHSHDADDYTYRADFHAAVSAGDNGSVIFAPYATHETQGGTSYQDAFGVGITGVYYGNDYRQSVQALIYKNEYFDPTSATQQGMHYRFDYEWLFYPSSYEFNFGSYIEHVHAAADADATNSALIFYSHNDFGLFFSGLKRLRKIELSLYFSGVNRQDTNTSTFLENSLTTSRRRIDYSIEIKPNISYSFSRLLKLNLYFDYSRTFSNMGAASYQDYNVLNRVAGTTLDYQMEWL